VWSVFEQTFRKNVSSPILILPSHYMLVPARMIFNAEFGGDNVAPKRRFTYGLHDAISQKIATYEISNHHVRLEVFTAVTMKNVF
jgi:hypothetical protein